MYIIVNIPLEGDDDDNDSNNNNFCAVALRPNASHGLLILEAFKSHTTTHRSR
jgi:hypothetical protein